MPDERVPCAACSAPVPPDARVCPACRALQPAREAIATGTTIERSDARIVVDVRVGEGGMGVVWRAWRFRPPGHPEAGSPRPLALKVLRPHAGANPEVRDLFLREADALRRLSHPNVVAYEDLFEHAGSLVLAIEYVDGDTLDAVLARHVARSRLAASQALPCMPMKRAWFYFQQLLGALAAIHALGMVHRDVKPSNVLVRRDGVVKLTDFGIVRFGVSSQATSGLALGTSAYMSPEQVLSQPIDGRSDLYSAAIVLYEMLAGRTPFSADRPDFLVRKDQVEARPPPIRSLVVQAPPVLDALFARALAKDPRDRFDGAIEMGDAFRAALGLPDGPEWRAQADLARTASTIMEAVPPSSAVVEAREKKLETLREFVVRGYKTMKMASM